MNLRSTLMLAATLSLVPIPLLASQAASNPAEPAAGSGTSASDMAGTREAKRMVPATADLLETVDARKMQPGADFKARLDDKVHLANGLELPSGTILEGTVATDDLNLTGNSKLALKFTQAELKDGKTIPIKATIVGVFTGSNDTYDGYMTNPPNIWDQKTVAIDQIHAISGVDLHSRIAGSNSGVFVTTSKDDIKLARGDGFDLAIAPARRSHSAGM